MSWKTRRGKKPSRSQRALAWANLFLATVFGATLWAPHQRDLILCTYLASTVCYGLCLIFRLIDGKEVPDKRPQPIAAEPIGAKRRVGDRESVSQGQLLLLLTGAVVAFLVLVSLLESVR
jgi:hypothetical protein